MDIEMDMDMGMEMEWPSPPVTDSDITAFETEFGIRLPDDYRAFLLKCNGGRPVEDWAFDFVEAGFSEPTSSCVCAFYCLNPDPNKPWYDLGKSYRCVVNDGVDMPPSLLPIAEDPGGNAVCLSVSGDEYGAVWFGNHELEDPETHFIVMSFIADSFTDFLDKLYVDIQDNAPSSV